MATRTDRSTLCFRRTRSVSLGELFGVDLPAKEAEVEGNEPEQAGGGRGDLTSKPMMRAGDRSL
jgi:hypothetical protein